MDIADRIADIIVEDHVDLIAENAALRRDAERFRWLASRLQTAYDENGLDFPNMTIYCESLSGYRSFRRVEATIVWSDVRDEPLAFGEAIDAAIASQ